jgi:hypothetical protein
MTVSDPELHDICRIPAPYRREVVVQEARYASGMRLLRLRIREGHRFTLLDLDAPTATLLADTMRGWAAAAGPEAQPAPDSPGDGPVVER